MRPHGAVQVGRTSARKRVGNDGTGTQGEREGPPQGLATPPPPAPPLPRVQYSDTVAQAANWDEYCTAALPDACTPYYRADLPAPTLDLIFGLQIQVRARNGRHLMMNAPACSPAPATASRAAQCPHPLVAPWLVAHIPAFPCGMLASRRLKEALLQERPPGRIAPHEFAPSASVCAPNPAGHCAQSSTAGPTPGGADEAARMHHGWCMTAHACTHMCAHTRRCTHTHTHALQWGSYQAALLRLRPLLTFMKALSGQTSVSGVEGEVVRGSGQDAQCLFV